MGRRGNSKQRHTLELDDDEYKRLKSFKIVYDCVMGEDTEFTDWNIYIAILLRRGIESAIKDITTSDAPLLTRMFDENPEFVSTFIANSIKTGSEKLRQEARQKLGFIKDWGGYG